MLVICYFTVICVLPILRSIKEKNKFVILYFGMTFYCVFVLRNFIYISWSLVDEYLYFNFFTYALGYIWADNLVPMFSKNNCGYASVSGLYNWVGLSSIWQLSEARYVLRQDVCHLDGAWDIIEVNLFILDCFFAIMISHINVSWGVFLSRWSLCQCHSRLIVLINFCWSELFVSKEF